MATDFIALGAVVKSRPLIFSGTGIQQTFQNGIPLSVIKHPYEFVGGQFTASKDNSGLWRSRNQFLSSRKRKFLQDQKRWVDLGPTFDRATRDKIRNWDIGGSFWTTKNSYSCTHPWISVSANSAGGIFTKYDGPVFPVYLKAPATVFPWPKLPSYEEQLLDTLRMGGAAIAATVPTSPQLSLSNLAGELMRDGLPDLVGRLVRRNGFTLKTLSEEYLNYEFGWKPLVSDLKKLAHTIIRVKTLVDQYERDSGKPISRRKSFPTTRSVTTSTGDSGRSFVPTFATSMYVPGQSLGKLITETVSTTDFWFSGTYSYFLDFGDDSRSRFNHTVSIAEKLLGFEITPEVVWNLLPWTWLIDWFVNLGDVFTNGSAFSKDGLIMRRGYVMCETRISTTYTLPGVNFRSYPQGVVSQTFESHSKLRKRAYPWGFGLDVPEFTPRQLAILGALGITRSGLGR